MSLIRTFPECSSPIGVFFFYIQASPLSLHVYSPRAYYHQPVNEIMLQVSLPPVIYLPQGVQLYTMSYLPTFTLSEGGRRRGYTCLKTEFSPMSSSGFASHSPNHKQWGTCASASNDTSIAMLYPLKHSPSGICRVIAHKQPSPPPEIFSGSEMNWCAILASKRGACDISSTGTFCDSHEIWDRDIRRSDPGAKSCWAGGRSSVIIAPIWKPIVTTASVIF